MRITTPENGVYYRLSSFLRGRSSTRSAHLVFEGVHQGNHTLISETLEKATPKQRRKVLLYRDEGGQQPLHVAASRGDVEALKILLAEDPECINNLDGSEWTPLLCAAANSHFATCLFLTSQSFCNLGAQNKSGTSALHQLARKTPAPEVKEQYVELLHTFIANPEIINLANGLGETPLHQASLRGNILAVQMLLEANANIHLRTKNEETAIHFAVRGSNPEVVDILLAAGADPNDMGNFGSAIDVAISSNNQEMIDKLSEFYDGNVFMMLREKRAPNLNKVLNHPELCLLFFYFLQKQYCAENLSFYVDTRKIQKVPEDRVDAVAKGIITKYIREGSLYEININSQTRRNILTRKTTDREMFDEALVLSHRVEGKTYRAEELNMKGADLRDYFVSLVAESHRQSDDKLSSSQSESQLLSNSTKSEDSREDEINVSQGLLSDSLSMAEPSDSEQLNPIPVGENDLPLPEEIIISSPREGRASRSPSKSHSRTGSESKRRKKSSRSKSNLTRSSRRHSKRDVNKKTPESPHVEVD